MTNIINHKNVIILSLTALALINLVVYYYLIFDIQGLIEDDFVIFSILKDNPGKLFSSNPYEIYYLFFRPLSYLLFYIYYYIMGLNIVLIKFTNLFFHTFTIISIYIFFCQLSDFLKVKKNYVLIFIFSFIISISVYAYYSVVWISNAGELYMFLFYLISLIFVLFYLKTSKIIYSYLYFLSFIISILFKQTSLHLPALVLIFIWFYKNEIDVKLYSHLKIFSITGVIISIIFSCLNFLLFQGNTNFLSSIWKKPFSVLGNILLISFPYIFESIYVYFMIHKTFSIIIYVFLFLSGLLFIKLANISYKKVIIFSLLILVVFFPKILGETDIRPLYLQFFIFSIFVFYITLIKTKQTYFRIILIITFCFLNLYSSIAYIIEYKNILRYYYEQAESFELNYHDKSNTFVISCKNDDVFPYYLNYIKRHDFGLDSVKTSPINMGVGINIGTREIVTFSGINCKRERSQVEIYTINKDFYLAIDYQKMLKNNYKIIETKENQFRGFDYIKFIIPEEIYRNIKTFVFFDGKEWKEI